MRPQPTATTAIAMLAATALTLGCEPGASSQPAATNAPDPDALVDQYASVTLTADLGVLSESERQMIPLLIEAAQEMDAIFWREAYGNGDSLLASLEDPALRQYAQINYGPWDRLNGNEPFIDGVGPKPPGANFYPADMTRSEFEEAARSDDAMRSLYTLIRRDDDGSLRAIPYSEAFAERTERAAQKLRAAAELAEGTGLKRYLELRAEALLSDEYRESDVAWLDMTENTIDVVIGPIETYEDKLFGYKAAHEGFVLIKDHEWSERLSRFAQYLPDLQRALPVPQAYRSEEPGRNAQLNAYDAIYYAGDANAGSKTIAINLPNDETIQLEKGTRRLQLKNAMRAKFDEILVPISDLLIAEEQRGHITFDAFFENIMFHEVAHGLGIKNTITDRGTVREALQEHASAMEEGKADVLGLFMITWLRDQELLTEGDLRDNYVTFLASIFRSVRFGASSAHGKANMVRFNFFRDQSAFVRDEATGAYRVDFDRMEQAMEALSERILTIQGDGDYEAAGQLLSSRGVIGPQLQNDLDRLSQAGIPVDIVFEQGPSVLQGL